MKLDIPPSGHGPRLILVRLCGFTSRLEEHGNGIAIFLCYYPTEAFTVCRFFCLITSVGSLKIEVNFKQRTYLCLFSRMPSSSLIDIAWFC